MSRDREHKSDGGSRGEQGQQQDQPANQTKLAASVQKRRQATADKYNQSHP